MNFPDGLLEPFLVLCASVSLWFNYPFLERDLVVEVAAARRRRAAATGP